MSGAGQPKPLWTPEEDAVLRAHYTAPGGPQRCPRLLPGRTITAVYNRAKLIGIPAVAVAPPKQAAKHVLTAEIEAAIRRAYSSGSKRGYLLAAAKATGKPTQWLAKQAGRIGVARIRRKGPYSEAEDALIAQWAHLSSETVARKLRAKGFDRSAGSIADRRRNLAVDTSDYYSTQELARLFGLNDNTIFRWVKVEGLVAERASDAPAAGYKVRRNNLKRWIAGHAQCIDLRKIYAAGSQFWFLDLAFGR